MKHCRQSVAERGRFSLLQRQAPGTLSNPKGSALKSCTHVRRVINGLSRSYMCVCIKYLSLYIYIWVMYNNSGRTGHEPEREWSGDMGGDGGGDGRIKIM